MQIAVASTDGIIVDQHFGRADRFMILEVIPDEQMLITVRRFSPYSEGDSGHGFDADRFAVVARELRGCERLYCSRIGEKPLAELAKQGIEVVLYQGPIAGITIS